VYSAYAAKLWRVFEGLKYAKRLEFAELKLNVDSVVVAQVITTGLSKSILGQAFGKNIRRLLDLNWK
jgi:ribonuclease HI